MRAEPVRILGSTGGSGLVLVAVFGFGRFFFLDCLLYRRDVKSLDGGLDLGLFVFGLFVLVDRGCLLDSEGGHLSLGVEEQRREGDTGVRGSLVPLLDLEMDLFFGLRLRVGRIHVE